MSPTSTGEAARHTVVSRFSVPRLDDRTADFHRDPEWLAGRLELFRRFFVPSVGGLGVPTVLLCSSASAGRVKEATGDLPWISVVVQDDWHGGWTGAPDLMVTRLDSDDALHSGWFAALDAAPPDFEAYCTKRFLRFDSRRRRLYARTRPTPSPLAAVRGGRNPYACDHVDLERTFRTHPLPEAYLLQVVHGGNLSNRQPRWWHFRYRVSLERLKPFGIQP